MIDHLNSMYPHAMDPSRKRPAAPHERERWTLKALLQVPAGLASIGSPFFAPAVTASLIAVAELRYGWALAGSASILVAVMSALVGAAFLTLALGFRLVPPLRDFGWKVHRELLGVIWASPLAQLRLFVLQAALTAAFTIPLSLLIQVAVSHWY
jgi:hypothetical protein